MGDGRKGDRRERGFPPYKILNTPLLNQAFSLCVSARNDTTGSCRYPWIVDHAAGDAVPDEKFAALTCRCQHLCFAQPPMWYPSVAEVASELLLSTAKK